MKTFTITFCLLFSIVAVAQTEKDCITEEQQETCVKVLLKQDCEKQIKFEKIKYLPANVSQIKEEHQKANYISFWEYITLGMSGDVFCCVDGLPIKKSSTLKQTQIFDADTFFIVFEKKENLITFYDKKASLYYQYEVKGKCDF
jgi:hypothetical protein